jgi:hypothetical protein
MTVISQFNHHRSLNTKVPGLNWIIGLTQNVYDSAALYMRFETAQGITKLTGAIYDLVRLQSSRLARESNLAARLLRMIHTTFNSRWLLLFLLTEQASPRQKRWQAGGGFEEITARKSLPVGFRHSKLLSENYGSLGSR